MASLAGCPADGTRGGGGGEPTAALGSSPDLDVHRHSDGRVYGLSARRAVLFPGSPTASDATIEAGLVAWIVTHEAELGLAAGLEPEHVELHRAPGFRSTAGALAIFRFVQTYRGLPILGPDGVVTLVLGPRGAVSLSGAIVDGRTSYAHADARASASAAAAERAMRWHAGAIAGLPMMALEVVHLARVALPTARAVGWAGLVRREGGAWVARVVVDAEPSCEAPVQPLWGWQPLAAASLADVRPLRVLTVDPAGEPGQLEYSDERTLTTGVPLLGSVDDASGQLQLATERVVMLDLQGAAADEVSAFGRRILSPRGEFLAEGGPALAAQVAHHLLHGWYDFIDGHLTEPGSGAKRWDSATSLYTHGEVSSDAPAGTFAPRVLAFVNAGAESCPAHGTACAGVAGWDPADPIVRARPELLHVPAGATRPEALGLVALPGDRVDPVTLAHELGHVVDLFTAGGLVRDFAPVCAGTCRLECLEGTTDEAPPLTESIAQLLALAFLLQSFEGVAFDYCPIVGLVAVNGDKAWAPGSCVPPGEDISVFQRADACEKPAEYCDRPAAPGSFVQCCREGEALDACTLVVPDVCPEGAAGPGGGVGTGTARAVPTGLCSATPGYRTNSLYQAFWQLLNGQRCEPEPPFGCVSMEWAPGVDPLDAATDALLYALRVNALTYDQLFDAMATYVACTYGAAAYEAFAAVACAHGIRDCDEPAPIVCETCGNGVREGDEACDGRDGPTRCDELPGYSCGTLRCDPSTCQLDASWCTIAAPPEEGSSTGSLDAEAVAEAELGCGCTHGAGGSAPWWPAVWPWPAAWLGFGRRRKRAPARA